MDNQDELSFEELAQLAAEDPLKWVQVHTEDNGRDPTNYGYCKKYNTHDTGGFVLIQVDSNGGTEGGGEHADVTFAIAPVGGKAVKGRVDGAVAYVEWSGYYESNSGTEWDEAYYLVEPRDVMVVQYHLVK